LFKSLFHRLGVRIVDTGETLTCTHQGDRITFTPGLDEASVDFTLEIYAFQAQRVAEQAASGSVSELEQFRVARELFASKSTGRLDVRRNPLIRNPLLRRVIHGKSPVHVYLASPDPAVERDARYTLIHIHGLWVVIPGLWGEPRRVFRLSLTDAMDLQRRLLAGMKANSWLEWLRIARWYVGWRRKVEAPSR
jgi:hypothetical protein